MKSTYWLDKMTSTNTLHIAQSSGATTMELNINLKRGSMLNYYVVIILHNHNK